MAPNHFTLCTRLRTVYTASVSVSCLSVSVTVREQMSVKSGFDDDHGDDEEAVQILKSRVSMPTRDKNRCTFPANSACCYTTE